MLIGLFSVLAQAGGGGSGIDIAPDPTGPGGGLVKTVIGWLTFYGLAGAIASVIIGEMVWGLSAHYGNGMHAGRGRGLVMGGAVGAGAIGLASVIVNAMFTGKP